MKWESHRYWTTYVFPLQARISKRTDGYAWAVYWNIRGAVGTVDSGVAPSLDVAKRAVAGAMNTYRKTHGHA